MSEILQLLYGIKRIYLLKSYVKRPLENLRITAHRLEPHSEKICGIKPENLLRDLPYFC